MDLIYNVVSLVCPGLRLQLVLTVRSGTVLWLPPDKACLTEYDLCRLLRFLRPRFFGSYSLTRIFFFISFCTLWLEEKT